MHLLFLSDCSRWAKGMNDTFTSTKLKQLRERYKLNAVVAPSRDEFGGALLLQNYVTNDARAHRFVVNMNATASP
jgi:hypothetical protein